MKISYNDVAAVYTAANPRDAESALRYLVNAHPDEPLFVIRGRDALALPVLTAYAEECGQHHLTDMQVQVWAHIDRFVAWQRDACVYTKLPDPYPGWAPVTEGDAQQDAEPTCEPPRCGYCPHHPV